MLILAQSGRFLAQSATQAGFTAWVADCFGDTDTLLNASRFSLVPENFNISIKGLIKLLIDLTHDQPCYFTYGSGIEHIYEVLNLLPSNFELIGNSFSTLKQVYSPNTFFSILDSLSAPYPTTQFTPPKSHTKQHWLQKSIVGYGGSHISDYSIKQTKAGHYFQRYVEGSPASILFLYDGLSMQILSINKQFNHQENYTFEGIEAPYILSESITSSLMYIIEQLCIQTGLIGCNSLDFIVMNNESIVILEVNPRPSASLELVDSDIPSFQLHFNACLGIHNKFSLNVNKTTSLRYLYAQSTYSIPENMIWPNSCHDLPHAGSIINQGQPICSSLVKGESQQVDKLHLQNLNQVKNQLLMLESE